MGNKVKAQQLLRNYLSGFRGVENPCPSPHTHGVCIYNPSTQSYGWMSCGTAQKAGNKFYSQKEVLKQLFPILRSIDFTLEAEKENNGN